MINPGVSWPVDDKSGSLLAYLAYCAGAELARGVHSTSWKCSLYFVYIFRTGRNFLIKFCSSDLSFSRNILKSLYLKFKKSNYLFLCMIYKLLDMRWISLIYILINEVGQWFYHLDHVTFSKNVFWSVNCTLFFYQIYSIQMLTL